MLSAAHEGGPAAVIVIGPRASKRGGYSALWCARSNDPDHVAGV